MKSFIQRKVFLCAIMGMLTPIQGVEDSSGLGWDDSTPLENILSGSGELPPDELKYE